MLAHPRHEDRVIRVVPVAENASAHRRRVHETHRLTRAWQLSQLFPVAPRLHRAGGVDIEFTQGTVRATAMEVQFLRGHAPDVLSPDDVRATLRALTSLSVQLRHLGLYHNDISLSNLLVEGRTGVARVLDWDFLDERKDVYANDPCGDLLRCALQQIADAGKEPVRPVR
ncbi:hypothetical protein ACFRMQ_04285 [Kitasatospora sp. NPDC056783]|uniref:hypothetical protein n=1 Tax=Kitasatospora sp. NPDC056783 TaxID=3345943 RepID=UPI0036AA4B3D